MTVGQWNGGEPLLHAGVEAEQVDQQAVQVELVFQHLQLSSGTGQFQHQNIYNSDIYRSSGFGVMIGDISMFKYSYNCQSVVFLPVTLK